MEDKQSLRHTPRLHWSEDQSDGFSSESKISSSARGAGSPAENTAFIPASFPQCTAVIQAAKVAKLLHIAKEGDSVEAVAATVAVANSTSRMANEKHSLAEHKEEERTTRSNNKEKNSKTEVSAAAAVTYASLYDELVHYNELIEDDASEIASVALRSVGTWYSVRSDDDRKIPAHRSSHGMTAATSLENPHSRSETNVDVDEDDVQIRRQQQAYLAQDHHHVPVTAASVPSYHELRKSRHSACSSNRSLESQSSSSSSSGAMKPVGLRRRRSPAASEHHQLQQHHSSNLPSVIYENETADDQTAISSLNNSTVPTSNHGCSSRMEILLDQIGETAAKNERDFAFLTAATPLTMDTNMGNKMEVTRSATSPCKNEINQVNYMRTEDEPKTAKFGNGGMKSKEEQDMLLAFQALGVNTAASNQSTNGPSYNSAKRRSRPKEFIMTTAPTGFVGSSRVGNSPKTSTKWYSTSIEVHEALPKPSSSACMNDYTMMQEALGMQGFTPPAETSGQERQQQLQHCSRSHGTRKTGTDGASAVPPRSVSPSTTMEGATSYCPEISTHPSSTGTPPKSDCPKNGSAAVEQYRIWNEIQAELERKEMELALQVSKQVSGQSIGKGNCNTSANNNDTGFLYPSQDAKPEGSTTSGTEGNALTQDEDEALREILRISQEEAAAAEAARNRAPSESEAEIKLVLQLSKKQAEEDRARLRKLQETVGELSEEEQLKLAMEQSLADSAASLLQNSSSQLRLALKESMQQQNGGEGGDNEDDKNAIELDLKLAFLRFSQAPAAEKEQSRDSLYSQQELCPSIVQGPHEMDADSNESSKESGTIQAIQNRVSLPAGPSHSSLSPTFAGRAAEQRSHMHRWGERDFSRHHQRHTPPVPVAPTNTHPEYSVDDSAVQPLPIDIPNSDNNGVHRISDAAAGTLCLPVDKRKVSEREEKDGSLKLIPRPSGSSL